MPYGRDATALDGRLWITDRTTCRTDRGDGGIQISRPQSQPDQRRRRCGGHHFDKCLTGAVERHFGTFRAARMKASSWRSAQRRGQSGGCRIQVADRVYDMVDVCHATWVVRGSGHRWQHGSRHLERCYLAVDFIETPRTIAGELAAHPTDLDRSFVDRESQCGPRLLVARHSKPRQNCHGHRPYVVIGSGRSPSMIWTAVQLWRMGGMAVSQQDRRRLTPR